MIDTHCHLEMETFDPDRGAVIERARAAGLEALVTIGSDLEGCEKAVQLCHAYDLVYATVGIHPHDAKDFKETVFERIKSWAGNGDPKVIGIGEIGLDYHYDHSPRDVQREAFARQLRFAKEMDLPAVIHSREAKKDTLQILDDVQANRGVMHCFSGDRETAKRAIAMGLHISIAGPVTFKNASNLQEIARIIPDESLLIETDAPYLTPEPLRGKRNEPAFIVNTAKFLAEIRDVSQEDIDRITTLNAKRLFSIGRLPEGEIAYKIRDSLYLNVTNRCTSRCLFCVRFHTDYVKGHNLRLQRDPTADELKAAIGEPLQYKEVVFCGYGEPLLRLHTLKVVASWVKQKGGKVRLNTNGHGNLIHGRNILPELQGLVDAVSVSLNAQNEETYEAICRPTFEGAYGAVLEFIREAKRYVPDVQVTVVEAEGVDIAGCRTLTEELGVPLRVRKLDIVG
ncbi:MAG TPA: YchF/TatD family DNA exonuclease [Dissulfurispiraceae bacterium]|nr:YchF/TatD family DNA exonuclease [Dissulfurispiraceae bacterium]